MSNWEEKFNEINPKIDSMIAEQVAKMNEARRKQAEIGKDVDSQEYKQAKADLQAAKMQKEELDKFVKPRLKIVSNYMAIKKQIEARLNEYSKVRNAQNEMINNRRQIGKCEQQEKEATECIERLTEKLGSGKLSSDEKSQVNKEITEAANKKQNAFNLRKQLNEKNNSLNEGLKEFKYGEVDRDTIKEKMAEERKAIEILDSKCEQLMDGKSVEYAYQQAVSKKETNELEHPEVEEKGNDYKFTLEKDENVPKADKIEYEDISSKSTFAEKHPGLAKIGNIFKKIKNKIFKNKEPELLGEPTILEDIKTKPETKLDEKIVKLVEKNQIELTDKEMDRLVQDIIKDVNEVGEKSKEGMESLRDSIKVTLSEEAKARLDKFRKDNGYRQGDTGPTMTEKGRKGLETIDCIAEGIEESKGREPGDD